MIRLFIFIPLLFILTGCPGDRFHISPWRPIQVTKDRVCFSENKNDVLSYYMISSVQKGSYKKFAVKEHVALSWPDTCLDLQLPLGYIYGVSYDLNNQDYRFGFFIDNDGNVHSPDKKY